MKFADLLGKVLGQIQEKFQDRPDLILAAWPQIVGPQIAQMTRAVSFDKGIFLVHVKTSTLYALLHQREKGRLLKMLRTQFPQAKIQDLIFKLG